MSKNIFTNDLTRNTFLSYLLALFPLSFILGNTVTNLILITLIVSSFYFFKLSFLKFKFIFLDKIILLFFSKLALVAQLDRALGYGPGGSGFKS